MSRDTNKSQPGKLLFDAIILAGGRGTRLGGVDKSALMIEHDRLVDRVVAAARSTGAAQIVVVGPDHAGVLADKVVREEPPFSGPLAAIGVGLDEVYAPWVMLLACDLQHPDAVASQLVEALLNHAAERSQNSVSRNIHGVILVDESGREQWLASCMNAAVLREALDQVLRERTSLEGASLVEALKRLELLSVATVAGSTQDIDHPEDLDRAQHVSRKQTS